MIASLTGTVTAIGLDALVLETGGIGYAVRTIPRVLQAARHGHEMRLLTELVVREDSLTLFGFTEKDELEVFRTATSVSGIGPRIALAMLSVLTPEELRRAVYAGDAKTITKVPGIGPKVAQRLILELKDKLTAPSEPVIAHDGAARDARGEAGRDTSDVLSALTGLGWQDKAAADAVDSALDADPALPDPALLRAALRILGGRR